MHILVHIARIAPRSPNTPAAPTGIWVGAANALEEELAAAEEAADRMLLTALLAAPDADNDAKAAAEEVEESAFEMDPTVSVNVN